MIPFLIVLLIVLVGALLYWLLVATEGVFLGRRVVIWLYDITAHRYDQIKEFDPEDERYNITIPIIRILKETDRPILLDVATGSGRVPWDLGIDPGFDGLIIGLDPAKKMLDQAVRKLEKGPMTLGLNSSQALLVQSTAYPLPFGTSIFDSITCLESLEFFPSARPALVEMFRVMKPGAILMTSRRRGIRGKLFLGRYQSIEEFESTLAGIGFDEIKTRLWELDYDMVTARKPSI